MGKWIPLVIALLCNAGANVLMKIGSRTAGPIEDQAPVAAKLVNFFNAATIWAIALFAANVLVYRKALDNLKISVAYPIMVSAGIVLVTLAAVALPVLNEKVSSTQIAGMAFIAVGVWLVGGS